MLLCRINIVCNEKEAAIGLASSTLSIVTARASIASELASRSQRTAFSSAATLALAAGVRGSAPFQ
jgi:hypothetical protein